MESLWPKRGQTLYKGMAKAPSKSWLPTRSSKSGQFLTERAGKASPTTTLREGSSTKFARLSASGKVSATGKLSASAMGNHRSSVSGRIDLPNGQSITTVRKDVMDRALGRGEFKKK